MQKSLALILGLLNFALLAHAGHLPPAGLYVNGDPRAQAAYALVKNARKSVDIEIYEMEDASFLELVREKAAAGLRVRIIKDPYPVPKADQCLWFPGLQDKDEWRAKPKAENNDRAMPSCLANAIPMIEEVIFHGGEVVPFYKPKLCGPDENPLASGACYEHGKMIIVDGKAALVSTGNFNPSNFCDKSQNPDVCNRDFSVVTHKANEVAELSRVFEGDLTEARYALHPLVDPRTAAARTITVSPYSLDPLVRFIQGHGMGPGHLIQVENQYLKEKNLNAALQAAAKSGAQVEVMVASLCSFSRPKGDKLLKSEKAIYDDFTQAGAQFKYFPSGISVQGREGYLHAKAIVIDRKYAWVGSVNGSNNALNLNREFGIFINNAADVARLSYVLRGDFHHAHAESFEQSWACAFDDTAKFER